MIHDRYICGLELKLYICLNSSALSNQKFLRQTIQGKSDLQGFGLLVEYFHGPCGFAYNGADGEKDIAISILYGNQIINQTGIIELIVRTATLTRGLEQDHYNHSMFLKQSATSNLVSQMQ